MSRTGQLTAALAGVALAATVVGALRAGKEEPKTEDVKTEVQAKALGAELRTAKPVALSDGGRVFEASVRDGGVVYTATSPCRWRPRGAKPSDCLKLLPDGGTYDFGEENTLQEGEWVGAGCVEVPCSVWYGQGVDGKFEADRESEGRR